MIFALEADPGRLTASHPLHDSLTEAIDAALWPHMAGWPVRILARDGDGPWVCVGAVRAWDRGRS